MPLLSPGQSGVSNQRGFPIDDTGASQFSVSISSETIQFFFASGTTRTTDAGQLTGVLVSAALAYGGIKNSDGSMMATNVDTSLTFTSTALTTEIDFPWERMEAADSSSWADRLVTAGTYLTTNGQYFVDYKQGIIYGRKASSQATATAGAYRIQQNVSGGTPSASSVVSTQAAASSAAGTTTADTTAGGVVIVAANSKRMLLQLQNNGVVTVYFGEGTVTSSFPQLLPSGTAAFLSKGACKVLAASSTAAIAFIDYTNA